MNKSMHACALVVGESGLLIRGPSGVGKSQLSLAIITHARGLGIYSALVADDRVHISVVSGRLMGGCLSGFAGLIEKRGEGIDRVQFETRAVLRLVIDLAPAAGLVPRMPSYEERSEEIAGIVLPRLRLHLGLGVDQGARVAFEALRLLDEDV